MTEKLGMCRTPGCLHTAHLGYSYWCPVCRPDEYKSRPTPRPTYASELDPEPWAR